MMQAPPDDTSWKAPSFRQNMVAKIEEAVLHCGAPTSKNAAEMENQVYQKANTKSEYLSFVARLILHIKEMGKPKGPPGSGMQGQMGQMGGGMMGNPMGGMGQMTPGLQQQQSQLVQSLGQAGQLGVQMGNPQGPPMTMAQQQGGGVNVNMGPQGGNVNMSQGMGAMGMGQQQQQQQQPGGGMMGQVPRMMGQNPGSMMGQQNPGGMLSQQMGMVGQQGVGGGIINQQGSLINQQGVRIMAPTSQVGMGGVIGQQGAGMMTQSTIGGMGITQAMPSGVNVSMAQQGQQGSPQVQLGQQSQAQMMNPNFIQQQLPNSQNQIPIAPGAINSPQMQQQLQNAQMQQHLLHQQQADQQQGARGGGRMRMSSMQGMQHMPRKGLHRPLTPSGDGGVVNNLNPQFSAGGQPGMQRPFMPPSGSPGIANMGGGPSSSPSPINIAGGNQPAFSPSPQPMHPHGSPAPASSGPRPFGSQMVPSPSTNLNTPMPAMAATPSPRNPEELACMKKIEELRRYTDMIQRMIVKIGNEDAEKSSKMKKLLDILLNPNRQVSMEILLKCEVALKKMEKQQEVGPSSQPGVPPAKDQVSPFFQIQEAILTTLKNGSASHTFLRTFRPSIEALTGQSAMVPDPFDEVEWPIVEEAKPDLPPILRREIKVLGNRFPVTIKNRGRQLPIQLNVSIGDPKLPRIPPLKLLIPCAYPDESPILIDFKKDYGSTSFLNSVAQAFKSRKVFLPARYTLYELLVMWEMSVRQVSNPLVKRKPQKRLLPLKKPPGRLGLPFL